jgi:hypothetical protein
MVIKGKTEELLVKQLKTCEKKMQELTDSIKRSNLRIMGIRLHQKTKPENHGHQRRRRGASKGNE